MRTRLFAFVGLALLAVGCQAAQPPTATPAPTPTLTAVATPTASAPQSPTATARPSPSATIDPCANSTEASPAIPPDAFLSVGNDPGVKGYLGSFAYCDTAADALPPRAENVDPVALGGTPVISVTVPDGERFASFRASYWQASEWQGDPIELAGDQPDEPRRLFAFDGPRAGDWMLAVSVTFPSGGDAIYYWHVTLP